MGGGESLECFFVFDSGYHFPIFMTKRLNFVKWCKESKILKMIELTAPWKVNIEDIFFRTHRKYKELIEFSRNNKWGAICLPVEIRC